MSSRDDVDVSDWETVEPLLQSSSLNAASSRQHLASSTSALLHSKGAPRRASSNSRPQQAVGHAGTPQRSPKVDYATPCIPGSSTIAFASNEDDQAPEYICACWAHTARDEQSLCAQQIWIAGILVLVAFWCLVSLLAISRLEKRLPTEMQEQLEFHTAFSCLWPKAQGAAAGSTTSYSSALAATSVRALASLKNDHEDS